MKTSRLYALLTALPPSRWSALRAFLASPYCNRRPELGPFLDFLEEQLLHLRIVPGKKDIARRFFSDEPFDAQRVRQLMSYLLQAAESFLAMERWRGAETGRFIQLAAAYRELGLGKHFRQTLRRAESRLGGQPYRQGDFFEQHYRLQWEAYQFSSQEKRTGEQNLQMVTDHLDLAFTVRKLRQGCLLMSHRAVVPTDYDFGLLPAVLEQVVKKELHRHPAVAVYYHAYRALAHPDRDDYFRHFKEDLLRHSAIFPPEERRDLFLLAVNYCIRRLNSGHEAYAAAGLELYRAALRQGDLLTRGVISRFAYRNIVAMGLKVGDLAGTERFIHDYRSHLEPPHQESMYSFSLARLAYRRKQYSEAIGLLQKADYDDLLLNLAAKTLLMKIYYECGEHELLASHLEAMRNFLRRRQVIGYHRTNYQHVTYLARKLLRINPFVAQEIEMLREEIKGTAVLTEREWLLEQLEKMKKN